MEKDQIAEVTAMTYADDDRGLAPQSVQGTLQAHHVDSLDYDQYAVGDVLVDPATVHALTIETESDDARFFQGRHVRQWIPFDNDQVKIVDRRLISNSLLQQKLAFLANAREKSIYPIGKNPASHQPRGGSKLDAAGNPLPPKIAPLKPLPGQKELPIIEKKDPIKDLNDVHGQDVRVEGLSKPETFYHITEASNLHSIKSHGLKQSDDPDAAAFVDPTVKPLYRGVYLSRRPQMVEPGEVQIAVTLPAGSKLDYDPENLLEQRLGGAVNPEYAETDSLIFRNDVPPSNIRVYSKGSKTKN